MVYALHFWSLGQWFELGDWSLPPIVYALSSSRCENKYQWSQLLLGAKDKQHSLMFLHFSEALSESLWVLMPRSNWNSPIAHLTASVRIPYFAWTTFLQLGRSLPKRSLRVTTVFRWLALFVCPKGYTLMVQSIAIFNGSGAMTVVPILSSADVFPFLEGGLGNHSL